MVYQTLCVWHSQDRFVSSTDALRRDWTCLCIGCGAAITLGDAQPQGPVAVLSWLLPHLSLWPSWPVLLPELTTFPDFSLFTQPALFWGLNQRSFFPLSEPQVAFLPLVLWCSFIYFPTKALRASSAFLICLSFSELLESNDGFNHCYVLTA